VLVEYPVVRELSVGCGHPPVCKGPTEQPRRMTDTMLLSEEEWMDLRAYKPLVAAGACWAEVGLL